MRHLFLTSAGLLLLFVLTGCGAGGVLGEVLGSGPGPLPGGDPGTDGEMTEDELAWALEILDRTNTERANANLDALEWDALAAAVSQAHNRDMRTRGFFAHDNPDGLDPGQRLRAAGVTMSGWGENIARGQATPAEAMNSWMNSQGHRENILRDWFTDLGVGVLRLSGGPWWGQSFVSR